ncbi:unnamed protein product, partial [Symbiodinium sp. KB8]
RKAAAGATVAAACARRAAEGESGATDGRTSALPRRRERDLEAEAEEELQLMRARQRAATWRDMHREWQDRSREAAVLADLDRVAAAPRLTSAQIFAVRAAASQTGPDAMTMALDVGAAQLDLARQPDAIRAARHVSGDVSRGIQALAQRAGTAEPEPPALRLWSAQQRADERERVTSAAQERRLRGFASRLQLQEGAVADAGQSLSRALSAAEGMSRVAFGRGAVGVDEGAGWFSAESMPADAAASRRSARRKSSLRLSGSAPRFRPGDGPRVTLASVSNEGSKLLLEPAPRMPAFPETSDLRATVLEARVSTEVRRALRSDEVSVGLLLRQGLPAHRAVVSLQRRFRVRKQFRWMRALQHCDRVVTHKLRGEVAAGADEGSALRKLAGAGGESRAAARRRRDAMRQRLMDEAAAEVSEAVAGAWSDDGSSLGSSRGGPGRRARAGPQHGKRAAGREASDGGLTITRGGVVAGPPAAAGGDGQPGAGQRGGVELGEPSLVSLSSLGPAASLASLGLGSRGGAGETSKSQGKLPGRRILTSAPVVGAAAPPPKTPTIAERPAGAVAGAGAGSGKGPQLRGLASPARPAGAGSSDGQPLWLRAQAKDARKRHRHVEAMARAGSSLRTGTFRQAEKQRRSARHLQVVMGAHSPGSGADEQHPLGVPGMAAMATALGGRVVGFRQAQSAAAPEQV